MREEQSLLFDQFKAFDQIERSHKLDFFSQGVFSYRRAQHVLSYHLAGVPWTADRFQSIVSIEQRKIQFLGDVFH